ncbi:hypothetical protein ACJX0J_031251, partial [Zea mays]
KKSKENVGDGKEFLEYRDKTQWATTLRDNFCFYADQIQNILNNLHVLNNNMQNPKTNRSIYCPTIMQRINVIKDIDGTLLFFLFSFFLCTGFKKELAKETLICINLWYTFLNNYVSFPIICLGLRFLSKCGIHIVN